jgi:hypothetical protein
LAPRPAAGVLTANSNNPIDLPATQIPAQIDPRAVPVIVKASSLEGIPRAIGIQEPNAFAGLAPKAGIDETVRIFSSKPRAKSAAFDIIDRVERRLNGRIAASQIMQFGVYAEHNFTKLRGPPSDLIRARHEPSVVMDRLEEGDFEGIAGIEHAE